jgi:hypothetical protein
VEHPLDVLGAADEPSAQFVGLDTGVTQAEKPSLERTKLLIGHIV